MRSIEVVMSSINEVGVVDLLAQLPAAIRSSCARPSSGIARTQPSHCSSQKTTTCPSA